MYISLSLCVYIYIYTYTCYTNAHRYVWDHLSPGPLPGLAPGEGAHRGYERA